MFIVLLLSVVLYYIYYLWDTYSYWRRKGVLGPTPLPIVGNYLPVLLFLKTEADLLHKFYQDYPNEPFVGLYKGTKPAILLRDPELIKQVTVKDYDTFFGKVLFAGASNFRKSMSGTNVYDEWKIYRAIFAPLLTRSKIEKTMPLTTVPITKYLQFVEGLTQTDYDFTLLQRKYALEIVGAMTLGREIGCFSDNDHIEKQSHEYNQRFLTQKSLYKLAIIFPSVLKLLMPMVHELIRTVFNFYHKITTSILDEKKKKGEHQNSFLDLMAELKGLKFDYSSETIVVDDEVIVQQVIITWFVNYFNTANAMAMILYELAQHGDLQLKVWEEIDTVLGKLNGNINIAAVNELKYLEMVIDETLRKYTTNGFLNRLCSKRYTFPNTNVTIDEGIVLLISHQGLHYDHKYFPDPDKFHPERFSQDNKDQIPPFAYLPFGVGPRNCIGKRLTKVVLMIGLAPLLYRFRVVPSQHRRLEPWPYTLGDNIPGGVWLRVQRINKHH